MEPNKLLDNIFEPILITDVNKQVTYYNHYFTTFSKTSPRNLKKITKLSELITSDTLDIDKFINNAIKSKDITISEEIEIGLTKSFGTNYVVVIKVIPLPELKQFIVCFNDLSVEKKLFDKYRTQLQELKQTHDQIIQADKLTSLGELTAGISHEISNPLTIASGSAEILEMLLENGSGISPDKLEPISSAISDIKQAHQRINSIIVNMKSYLHKSEEKKEYCKLAELIRNSINLVKPSADKAQISIQEKFSDQNIVILANSIKIEQVIVNLLKNSVQALIKDKTSNPEIVVTLAGDPKGNYSNIVVRDNGPGVPPEIRNQIFETFFTTKEVGEGTGLGLSISNKIITTHTGTLSLEDTEKGCAFKIQLPLIEMSSFAENDDLFNMTSEYTSKQSKRILVLDNEVHVLNILSSFIKEENHMFIGSISGIRALKLLEEMPVDLIITDYHMPEMSGSEFSKAVRKLNINCPLLYLTSIANIKHFQTDKEKYNVSGLILKPFTKDEVIKTINLALQENGR